MTLPQEYAAVPVPGRPGSALTAAVLVFLGGYLVISGMGGFLIPSLAGLGGGGPMQGLLLVGQLLFALAVLVAGLWVAPGGVAAKATGSALVVGGVALAVFLQAQRIVGEGPAFGPVVPQFTFANSWFVVVLLGGAAWLLVRRAGAGWLALIAALLLAPLPFALLMSNVESALLQILMSLAAGVAGAVIVLAGRPLRD